MKLSRLSKLDLQELTDSENNYQQQLAALRTLLEQEEERYAVIRKDLAEIKKVIGKDERLTEIIYTRPMENVAGAEQVATRVKNEIHIY